MAIPAHLRSRIVSADDAAALVPDNAIVGMSGFTRAGDAKALPEALAKRAAREPFRITLATGASLGYGTDGMLARSGALARRFPFQSDPLLRRAINAGDVLYMDQHLSETAEAIRAGHVPAPDVAIIEAIAITKDGVIPTTSVGNSALFVQTAKTVIVEINAAQSADLAGVHDVYDLGPWGARKPIPLVSPMDRIGVPYIPVDHDKIAAIVLTDRVDDPAAATGIDSETADIAGHLLDFLRREVTQGRFDYSLAPLQAGIGSVANAVLGGFTEGPFGNLSMFSEVLQDSTFDLIDAGKLVAASGSSITLGPRRDALASFAHYRDHIVLRPQDISNHPEIVRRLGLITLNTALEADIYGNVNSTHVNGSMMFNGIGGSGDFARNARLSIFVCRSIAKGGAVSAIVPMASHVDHGAHDVDILATEQGLADLRGLAPRERASVIIENCMHPAYRDLARDYFRSACRRGGQTPHRLEEALTWHERAEQTGTMAPAALKAVRIA